ncbi:MAG: 5-formyltetrahydrofolate cyclo-ligase [Lachnospiraceae bacterium]|nr:5-formyltetrahydrofolate cyclo-ligase [Lachnospiraceae bacterium]
MKNEKDEKKEIRKNILKVRDEISAEERASCNDKIKKYVLTQPVYEEAEAILAYASYRSEVDTTALIRQALADGKYVFAPKVSGDEMEFWQITAMEDLREGYRGIPEPVERVSFPEWLAEQSNAGKIHVMMWMPGAVFDKERHRIGYGKGFYDRYLSRLTGLEKENCCKWSAELHLTTVALAYSCQVLEQIPYESHDIRPDMLITEKGVLL